MIGGVFFVLSTNAIAGVFLNSHMVLIDLVVLHETATGRKVVYCGKHPQNLLDIVFYPVRQNSELRRLSLHRTLFKSVLGITDSVNILRSKYLLIMNRDFEF